jgi:hypothetical protein
MAYAVKSITWLMQGRRLAANPLHPPDGRRRIVDCICPLWRSHSLADLFEEISPDVRLRVALLWPCLIEAFDFCFAATHD